MHDCSLCSINIINIFTSVRSIVISPFSNFINIYFFCQYSCSVQSLSPVWLFASPWTATCQASLSITNSWSLLKFMSIESLIPSNHPIFCHPPFPLVFNFSLHQSLFQWISSLYPVWTPPSPDDPPRSPQTTHSNLRPCPLSWWCYLTISSSASLFFLLSIFPSMSLFQWIRSSHLVAKVLELQLQHQSFQWIFRGNFL